ncbi:MAG: glycogen-binding domain-containing protein [Candidatus Omnitrophica bacterium]|nr:glycogen-binding domain-containing protein [Candidatus Omnitrophota bacterium]
METKTLKTAQKVHFKFFAPLSLTVQVAGTFNDWSPVKGTLKKDSQGNWSGVFELKPGRHEYRFVVDGNWENDQNNNEIVPNNLGTFNNVIVVR